VSGATLQRWLARAAGAADGAHRGVRLLDRDERATLLSWREVERRGLEVAGGLQALGVVPGERVALLFPTGAEFFAAFFGTLLAGAVPAPLYPPVRLGRLAEYHERTAAMLQAAGAPVLLVGREVGRILGETVARARPRLGARALAELPAAPARPHLGEPGELALVQFSSGTTVEPKPVALAQRALTAQALALNALWPDTPEVTHAGCSWLPLYHDMGLIGCVLPALERVADLTLLPPEQFLARPALWLRAIARARATISPAPNFAYALCVERVRDEELAGVDLSCWRVALDGAETVVPEVLRRFAARFAPWGFRAEALTPVYGLSEAALAVTFSAVGETWRSGWFAGEPLAARGEAVPLPPVPEGGGVSVALPLPEVESGRPEGGVSSETTLRPREIVSVGRPLPGFVIEIRDEAGGLLPACRVGRVWVRGPSLMEGYLGRPEATARALRDGWLDTGDRGFLRDGELYLAGRAKDMILVRGRNHAPEEVEQAVGGIAGVRAGCVAAVSYLPEGVETERLLLFVEHRRGAGAAARGILPEACSRAVLAATGLAVQGVVVLAPGTLPRTSSGKIRRQETLRRHLAGELAPPEPVNTLTLARALIRSRLARLGHRAARRRAAPEAE
jgi:acyl-CoA synthetase (AMP-forming)/AMP-acid ligase II